ncbi:MAG: hypothetical protein U0325_11080 [Polyangiales bacterium]
MALRGVPCGAPEYQCQRTDISVAPTFGCPARAGNPRKIQRFRGGTGLQGTASPRPRGVFKEKKTMLTVGDRLPSFALKAAVSLEKGKEFADITDKSYEGKWLVLFAWPMDFVHLPDRDHRVQQGQR